MKKIMMKSYLSIAALMVAIITIGQNSVNKKYYGPDDHVYCGNNIVRDKVFDENPALKIQDSIDQAQFEADYQDYLQDYDPNARATYVIPVVVHICHLGGVDNISDEQVYDAIQTLNEDFSATNNDLSSTVSPFDGVIGNADIEFRLATKAPNGSCHKGITRTYTANTVHDGDNDLWADVYNEHGNWPQNEYMNIFVCQDPAGAAGYTQNPANWYNPDGMGGSIYLRHDYMGTIGTSSSFARHTLSHEVGHWLNLSHCWGSNNNPGQSGACSDDDGVGDTPRTIGWTSCNLNGNTCTNDATDGYWASDVIDNVQNIMEYSYCSTMFTQGQVARMHTAINSSIAERNNLWTPSNLAATGTDGPGPLCDAIMDVDTKMICAGESVQFSDLSYHTVTNRTWTFNGGTPSTATTANPTVTYNTPGIYSVTLDVSDGSTNLSTTETDYIVVLDNSGRIMPYVETFETLSAVPDNQEFMTFDSGENGSWELTNTVGSQGSNSSAKLSNYNVQNGGIDELVSGTIDLSTIDPNDELVFTFDYAYRKVSSQNDEWLKVYISNDCGDTWVVREVIHDDDLSSVATTSDYVPASEDEWYTVDVSNIFSSYFVSNFRYKFEFESDGGNNIYIDNINIYPISMTDVSDESTSDERSLYPNPTTDITNLSMNAEEGQSYEISLYSAVGKKIQVIHNGELKSGKNKFEIDTKDLAKGLYVVRIMSEGRLQTVKLVKE